MKLNIVLLIFGLALVTKAHAQSSADYLVTSVTFPSDYQVGDYIEFAKATPIAVGASGHYEISIAYTRGNIAAAATHIASSTHSNPNRWLEAGRINNNVYTANGVNFTVDHNTSTRAFRIRAINTLGINTILKVDIKIRSINFNTSFSTYNITGTETGTVNLLPMTYDWDLIVGNTKTDPSGKLAIKAISNGNVGIGTATPTEKLSVKGNIRAKEIKVETANWPDYVFEPEYKKISLDSLEQFISTHKHLPNIQPAKEIIDNGIALGELNKILVEKIEEMTLYLIEQNKQIKSLQEEVNELKR